MIMNNLRTCKRLFSFYLPLTIAVAYLILAVASIQYDDITFDEPAHLLYGVQIAKGSPNRDFSNSGFRSTMPISVLNALPRIAEQIINPGLTKNDWGKTDVKNGRYVTILFTLILLFYCFRFSALLSSDRAGCIVMAFIAFDPNILAHSRLVTTDLYAATGFIATIYYLWKWLIHNEYKYFYYWCVAIAIAQCCKPNNILLYPVSLVPMVFYSFKNKNVLLTRRALAAFLSFVLIQIIVINAFFLFSGPWGCSLAQLHFKSGFFKSLQTGWLAKIPIPFSRAYIDTFDLVQYERETFDGTAFNYLNEELRYKRGFWNYYLICYSLKTPVISILLSLAGAVYSFSIKKLNTIYLFFGCWPCFFVLVFLSNSSIQSGYRYLLPVTCLLLIFSGWFLEKMVQQIAGLLVICFCAIPLLTAIMIFPGYLSYTNLLITDKKMAYLYFADSNLNWGQRSSAMHKFLASHPGYIFEPPLPLTGMIIVDLNNLVGLRDPGKFKWLRDNYTPVASIDGCYLVYAVKQLPGIN